MLLMLEHINIWIYEVHPLNTATQSVTVFKECHLKKNSIVLGDLYSLLINKNMAIIKYKILPTYLLLIKGHLLK